jgi:hypothetical protein
MAFVKRPRPTAHTGVAVSAAAIKTPRRGESMRAQSATAPAQPKATTLRLNPNLDAGLSLLQRLWKTPRNKLINDAVQSYLERRTAEIETDLKDILVRVQAYRRADPQFKRQWEAFVDAEARHAQDDPVEGGVRHKAGPAQTLVRDLLRG